MFERLRQNYSDTKMIREAIENYPDGLCFSASDGRVILANRKINSVSLALTGHTVTNAADLWNAVCENAEDAADSSQLLHSKETLEHLVRINENLVLQFRKTKMKIGHSDFFQYEAVDVTKLYSYSKELSENNEKLKALHERQREVLKTIVQNNVKEELLHAKMKIHGRMGELLIQTNKVIEDGEKENLILQDKEQGMSKNESKELTELYTDWETLVSDLRSASLYDEEKETAEIDELIRVAGLIGCKVIFDGKIPKEPEASHLFCILLREALTNAVRHAHANELFVHIEKAESEFKVRISDNGDVKPIEIHEGGGLATLRTKLESKGSTLKYEYENGLVLKASILRK